MQACMHLQTAVSDWVPHYVQGLECNSLPGKGISSPGLGGTVQRSSRLTGFLRLLMVMGGQGSSDRGTCKPAAAHASALWEGCLLTGQLGQGCLGRG